MFVMLLDMHYNCISKSHPFEIKKSSKKKVTLKSRTFTIFKIIMRKSNKSIEPYLNYMQMQCVKDHVNVFGKTLDKISIWAEYINPFNDLGWNIPWKIQFT